MDKLLYQMREEGADRYLFLVNTERLGLARDVIVKVRGSWQGRVSRHHDRRIEAGRRAAGERLDAL